MIRAALTALADRIMRPRYVCPHCRCRTHNIPAHIHIDHQGWRP